MNPGYRIIPDSIRDQYDTSLSHACHPGLDPGLIDDDLYTRILVLLKIYLELGLLRVDFPGKYANMAFVSVIHF